MTGLAWSRVMADAPRDRPILAWCAEPADCPDCPDSEGRMCLFHAHAEGLASCGDGPAVVVWGGGWADDDCWLPDWWFRRGSEFEEAARPVAWADLPTSAPEG